MRPGILSRRLDQLIPALAKFAAAGSTSRWGFDALDAVAPWPLTTIAVVSAPKGGGKTSFAIEVGRRHARHDGPVLFVALEQTDAMLTSRAYAQEMGIAQGELLSGARAVDPDVITDDPLFIVTRSEVQAIAGLLDEIAEFDERPPLLVVDYVQRYAAGASDMRVELVDVMSKLLALTESRKMRTLIVSQTSRSGSRKARSSWASGEDLVDADAESGALESDAAVKLVMTFKSRQGEAVTEVRAVAAKNRFGAVGATVGFRFDGATGQWTERTGVAEGPNDAAGMREHILDAYRAAGANGFKNATACRGVVGGRSEVFGKAHKALMGEGRVVKSNGRLILRVEG